MSTVTGNKGKGKKVVPEVPVAVPEVPAKAGRGKKAADSGERVALKVTETHPPLPSKVKTMMVGLLWFLEPNNLAALATANSPDIDDDVLRDMVQTANAIRDLVPTFSTVEAQIEFFEPAKDVVALYKQHVKIPVANRKKAATAQRKLDAAAEKAAERAALGKPVRKSKAKKAVAPEPEPVAVVVPPTDEDEEATVVEEKENGEKDSIFGADNVVGSPTFTDVRAAASQKSFEEDTHDTYAAAEEAAAVEEVPVVVVKEKKSRKPKAPAAGKKARVENVY